MAIRRDVTEDDHVFLGDDKLLEFRIYSDHALTTPVDVASWDLEWVLRKADKSADPALIVKTIGSPGGIAVTGTFDADPETNTQKVVVTLEDTDSYEPEGSPAVALKKGRYRHALKRMDDGAETVLTFGDFVFLQATTR